MAKLRLLSDVYNQPQNPDDPRDNLTVEITKGEEFEPKNAAEAKRLQDLGAAEPASKSSSAKD